jgi:glutamine amidotransferase
VLAGTVRWIPPTVKRPQMQWNQLDLVRPDDPMLTGLGDRPWFYFVHSLHGVPQDPEIVVATCDYGGPLNAAFRLGNVFAVQFHPEKSASAGLALLGNFVRGLRVLVA